MINFIVSLLLNGLAAYWSAHLMPGVRVESFWHALFFAFVLGIVNTVIQPILFFLTIPVTILTLGLFTFVLNALMIWLTSVIVPGFGIAGFGWVLLYSVILTFVSAILHWFGKMIGLIEPTN